jgi:3-deoxy-D-manno-octulosonic acid kinase
LTTIEWHEARSRDAWWMIDTRFAALVDALEIGSSAGIERLVIGDARSSVRFSGRAPTRIVALPGERGHLHVRRVLHGGMLAPLWRGRVAGFGRVRKELLVSVELLERGAPVAQPVLAVAQRSGALWRAALVTLHIEGAKDGITFLCEPCSDDAIELAARAAGRAVRRFHEAGGHHRELHLGNLLLRPDADDFEAWVIDLDRGRAGGPPSAARRRRELRRLEHSLDQRGLRGRVGARGVAGFLAGYAQDVEPAPSDAASVRASPR